MEKATMPYAGPTTAALARWRKDWAKKLQSILPRSKQKQPQETKAARFFFTGSERSGPICGRQLRKSFGASTFQREARSKLPPTDIAKRWVAHRTCCRRRILMVDGCMKT